MTNKRTKIVATIGMASETEEMLKKMSDAGVNVFRLNFSHGDHSEHAAKIEKIRRLGLPGAILLDTKGPEIRTRNTSTKVELKKGDKLVLTIEETTYEESGKLGVSYKEFINDITVGDFITIDESLIAKAVNKTATDIEFEITKGFGKVGSNRHINVQGRHVSLPTVTENDWKDIDFGIEQKVDYIALSFARTAKDINDVREYCAKKGHGSVKIIAKIENGEAVDNLEEIAMATDGIMVARGDLAKEIPFAKVPRVQRRIMELCSYYKKTVIVATQMLASMVTEINPTRAEISDVANAVFSGTDAVMLSEEATKSEDPSHVVATMAEIAEESEKEVYGDEDETVVYDEVVLPLTPEMAEGVDAIVVISKDYNTTRFVSNARVALPTFSFINDVTLKNQMNLLWNVKSFELNISDDFEANVAEAEKVVAKMGDFKKYALISETTVKGKVIPTVQVREM